MSSESDEIKKLKYIESVRRDEPVDGDEIILLWIRKYRTGWLKSKTDYQDGSGPP